MEAAASSGVRPPTSAPSTSASASSSSSHAALNEKFNVPKKPSSSTINKVSINNRVYVSHRIDGTQLVLGHDPRTQSWSVWVVTPIVERTSTRDRSSQCGPHMGSWPTNFEPLSLVVQGISGSQLGSDPQLSHDPVGRDSQITVYHHEGVMAHPFGNTVSNKGS